MFCVFIPTSTGKFPGFLQRIAHGFVWKVSFRKYQFIRHSRYNGCYVRSIPENWPCAGLQVWLHSICSGSVQPTACICGDYLMREGTKLRSSLFWFMILSFLLSFFIDDLILLRRTMVGGDDGLSLRGSLPHQLDLNNR